MSRSSRFARFSRQIVLRSAALLLAAGACRSDSAGPGDTPDVSLWASVSSGASHTCGVRVDGTAACWGRNRYRQLAREDTAAHSPASLATSLRWQSLSAGDAGTCGIARSGGTHCWGRLPSFWRMEGVPVPVGSDLRLHGVQVGGAHACGIGADGRAYCWGDNSRGQLGAGMIDGVLWGGLIEPTPVAGGRTFAVIVPGEEKTCALDAAGAHYCWGGGSTFGPGTVPPQQPLAGGPAFDTLVVGGPNVSDYQCGLTVDRDAYCWGYANRWQVGAPTMGDYVWPPARVGAPAGVKFRTLTAGGDDEWEKHGPFPDWSVVITGHRCALTDAGDAYCWGSNEYGQLGDGTTQSRGDPRPVAGGLAFAQIDAGGNHTCGVTVAGAIYCWGDNRAGQLGSGARGEGERQTTPQPLPGPL